MAARVDVARVDRLRETRGRAVARWAIRPFRELLELRELERRRRLVRPRTILAVLLRPVERAVGEADQLIAPDSLRRECGDPCAHGDGADLLELRRADALDDRAGDADGRALVEPGEEHGELVAAEPEALATLAEACGDLPEDAVADRMPVVVVDPLEVVDVHQAQAQRLAVMLGLRQLALQSLVEVTVVAEAREWIGERESHCAQRFERRALIERDREQRTHQRDRQEGGALPQHDEHQRGRRHQRERCSRLPHVRAHQLEERLARIDREHRADQDEVDDPVVDERADREPCEQSADRVLGDGLDREPGGERREREHRAVVGDTQRRTAPDEMRHRRSAGRDQHTGLPAEEEDPRDREDEAERDSARVHSLDRHRESFRQHHADEETHDREDVAGRMCGRRVRHGSHTDGRDPRHTDGGHERENSRGNGGGSRHRPVEALSGRRSGAGLQLRRTWCAAVPSATLLTPHPSARRSTSRNCLVRC